MKRSLAGLALVILALVSCSRDEGLDTEALKWMERGDGRERRIECNPIPMAGAPRGTPVHCRCFVDSNAGKAFEVTEPRDALGSYPRATETANEKCGWNLALAR